MNYRYNKRLEKHVSEIGFGAWQLGGQGTWGHMTKEAGIKLVQDALENGVTFFDTAPNYGHGNSELILGEALKGHRDQVVINTKVGHGPNNAWEFTKEGIRQSVERSLKRLQIDYIDSVILHSPEFNVLNTDNELFDELRALKKEGKIKLFGVSIDSLEELKTVLKFQPDIDTIEIMFNMIHQEARFYFDECLKRDLFLIIKVPLDSGWLSGKYNASSTFNDIRSRWDKQDIETRAKIVKVIQSIVSSEGLVQQALQYILHFDAVTSVIPGMKNQSQLLSNVRASEGRLSSKEITQINTYYETVLKDIEIPW